MMSHDGLLAAGLDRQYRGEIERLTRERDEALAVNLRWQRNSIDTWYAMNAMRDSINEVIPMPSTESDMLEGPEISVFCERVATAVIEAMEAIRAIPVPAAPDLTLTPDEVRQVREALGQLARLEVPDRAGNGLHVARTLYCNTQVTAFSVRKARAALAILDGKKQ